MAKKVDNEIYRRLGHAWWDDEVGEFSSLRYWLNPVRCDYFARVLLRKKVAASGPCRLLDVGCGGGMLAEEFARSGIEVTGIDPAPETIAAARTHASGSGLRIRYEVGSGELLPFPEGFFDYAACCNVLEHVDDPDSVIGEIARVLRPGGLLFFHTINRTLISRVAIIKVMQEWRGTAFATPNLHVWEKFIKPAEMTAMLRRHGLEMKEMRGIAPRLNPFVGWLNFRRRARGGISFRELGRRLDFHESRYLDVSYMGFAVRSPAGKVSGSGYKGK